MIPKSRDLRLPVLKSCAHGRVAIKQVIPTLADEFNLTAEERQERVSSGVETKLANRANWAKSYLKQAGLVRYTGRGEFEITDEGQKVLQTSPERISNELLMQYDSFREFMARRGTRGGKAETVSSSTTSADDNAEATPDETLSQVYDEIQNALADELLDRVRSAPPAFFEWMIGELLVAMGYGGADASRTLGGSGDEGVDGVIDQDALGVDQIYVQAKRYQEGNPVGAGAIRDFFGGLSQKKAQKGIFFTTSAFSSSAQKAAVELGRIVLIDGPRLADLMVKYGVGCQEKKTLSLKKIDEDFFDQ